LQKFNFLGLEQAVEALKGKPVYLTIDLDVLDPSVFPGTGTPEAGGVSFTELLNAIIKVSELNIVGCDMNELSPPYDQSGSSTAAACKLLRELLLAISA
jgi:agmatinase